MRFFFATAVMAFLALGIASPSFADTSGTFKGASGHATSGGVSVVKNADGTATVTFDSAFFHDGAPDPRVGFGKNGKFDKATILGKLRKLKGTQSYVVPASVNVDSFNEIYIWCLRFAVPLGVAKLG